MKVKPITASQALEIVRDPAVWRVIACDEMDPARYTYGDWTYLGDESGFMGFRRILGSTAEVHIAMRRKGASAYDFAQSCLAYMRTIDIDLFVAPICDWNRAALLLARRCGFSERSRLDDICHRDGVAHQVILMESK